LKGENMNFENSTIYFLPIAYGDYNKFISETKKLGWDEIESEKLSTRYLLSYVDEMAVDRNRYCELHFKNVSDVDINMFGEKLGLDELPVLTQIRLSCFSTGVAFMEFWISYGNMKLDDIVNFAYMFKKACKTDGNSENEKSLMMVAKSLIPSTSDVKLFFTDTVDFKRECNCFHMLKFEKEQYDNDVIESRLNLLKWNYDTNFDDENMEENDSCSMLYKPYAYDNWGGSIEALANVSVVDSSKDDRVAYFVNNYKYSQLTNDYRFLYLVLLNQRFSSIKLISNISQGCNYTLNEIKRINCEVVNLKNAFSYRVISDDRIYQNVYSRMCGILDIENLIKDLEESEEQLAILQNMSAA
jgi:hypothetical protein